MSGDLLTSKLFIPHLRSSLVPRSRLIESLNEGLQANRKLTLVSAPAGFGKTTLVVDWLRQLDRPAAWLSLEEADNHLPRFLSYLGAAFQAADSELGTSLLGALQSSGLPPIDVLLTDLLNEIASRADPLLLVLDDLHLLTAPEVRTALEFILTHQPSRLHMVFTTREDPDLPLALLRARDQLNEVRARDLRFTQKEAGEFLRGVMGLELSSQDVAALEDRTEGWAAGLQLAGLSMQRQSDLKSFIAEFSGSHRHILDYLTDEVLDGQPEHIRAFLLQTSILDRLSSPLCDALTGRTDGATLLEHLDSANLFIIPLDEERHWYRYHHLFGDLLRSQLMRTHPEDVSELHRRASRWYAGQGDIQSAVHHALQDSNLSQAAQLLEQHALPLLYRGQVAMVIGWFNKLPEAALMTAPMLCISKAWALAVMQRTRRDDEVERALQAAQQALAAVNASDTLRSRVAGHAASIRAFILQIPALLGNKPQELIDLSQRAQELLPVEERGIRSVNGLNIGYAYLALADVQSARDAYQGCLEDGLAGGNFYAGIYGPINLVLIALLMGNLDEALQLCDDNIDRFNRILAGRNFPPIGALYILKGSILLEENRLAEAEQLLMQGLELIRWTGETQAHRTCYRALARLRAIQGDRAGMMEAVKTLEETFSEDGLYPQALKHRLSLHHWAQDLDVKDAARAWLASSQIKFAELPIVENLDYAGTTRFQTSLHIVHVLASLANENPAGYPLEAAHAYLQRQAEFAANRGVLSWIVEIAIAQALLYQTEGKKEQAKESLHAALRAAAPTGLLRVFVDEAQSVQALLVEIQRQEKAERLLAYLDRILDVSHDGLVTPKTVEKHVPVLSDRELEVLRCLAQGLSYEEIGRQLFLSLNTVQFHVKNIYRKLGVNKRTHAIEQARSHHLI